MLIKKLTLTNFRAHKHSTLDFGPRINLIHGPNGSGKTNVLEAIHYLCIGKSFIASKDSYALKFGETFFDLKGEFEPRARKSFSARLVFQPSEGKHVFVNDAPLERLADLVGKTPVVVFAPGDHALTDGAPEVRRRFLDNTLSQAKPGYLNDVLKYRRTMKQRNALLAKGRYLDPVLLQPWNEEMTNGAARITAARARFISKFDQYLAAACEMIQAIGETPTIEYKAFSRLPDSLDQDEIAVLHREAQNAALSNELQRRRSLVGPHRDDLIFRLNDVEVRRYASQGQHRTFGMALKLAKFLYLQAEVEETPLLLLDDVFGDLDRQRKNVFLELLQSEKLGQSIITAADPDTFKEMITFENPVHAIIEIRQGSVHT